MDEFMAYASRFMTELGGAIPFILNIRLDNQSEDWRKRLETDARKPLDLEELSVLQGVPIYLCGDPRPTHLGPVKIDGDCSWTLASDDDFACELQRPDTARACLLIYINKLGLLMKQLTPIEQILEKRHYPTALLLLDRTRAFVHELVDAMWSRRRLMEKQDSLVWSRNELQDWCVEVSQFDLDPGTPPTTAFGATPGKWACPYSCDAGRAWEHSLTRGAAFFQGDLDIVSAELDDQGDRGLLFCFCFLDCRPDRALEVLNRPERLIETVREIMRLDWSFCPMPVWEQYVALARRIFF